MNVESSTAKWDFSFDLRTLFFVTSLYALGLKFGLMSLVVTTLLLIVFWPVKNRNGCAIAVLLLLAFLTTSYMEGPHVRPGTYRTQCMNNMRQVGFAVHNYEAAYRHFPPTFKADENGKPLLSWRVLLLPYLGEEKLFAKFDLGEPWDGPNNIKLLDEVPMVFQCPCHQHKRNTVYKLVAGPGTAFEDGKPSTWSDITDGTSNTIMLTEDFANPVPWTKPADLSVDQVVEILSHASADRSSHCAHEIDNSFDRILQGTCCVLMDGSNHFIGPSGDPKTAKQFCLIADGENPHLDGLRGESIKIAKPEGWIIVGAYISLLAVFPWVCRKR